MLPLFFCRFISALIIFFIRIPPLPQYRQYAKDGERLVPDFELPILAEALGATTDWMLGKE